MDTTKRVRIEESKLRLNEYGQPIGKALPDFVPPKTSDLAISTGLEGSYCTLELIDFDKHAQDLFDSYSLDDGRMWTYLALGPFETVDELKKAFKKVISDKIMYVVIDKSSSKAVGVLTFMRIDPAFANVEIGNVIFSPLLQRTRVATETFYLMLKQCFSVGFRRCEWKCDSLNAPSQNAARRLGFQQEGLFRQSVVYKGRSRDTMWFGMIDTDWESTESRMKAWLEADNFDSTGKQTRRLQEC